MKLRHFNFAAAGFLCLSAGSAWSGANFDAGQALDARAVLAEAQAGPAPDSPRSAIASTGTFRVGYGVQVRTQARPDGTRDYLLSDTLVKDLSCENLSEDDVLRSLQPNAFGAARNIPIANWTFKNFLANCWSLSLAQRAFYYLARPGAGDRAAQREGISYALDLMRGTVYGQRIPPPAQPREEWERYQSDSRVPSNVGDEPSTEYRVFPTADWDSFIGSLEKGVGNRDLRSEIEYRQENVLAGGLLSPANLPFNLGGFLEKSDKFRAANEATLRKILDDLDRGRMTLVIIRPTVAWQHAIVIKSVRKLADDRYEFSIYDSNHPYADSSIEYKEGRFYAPGVAQVTGQDNPDAAVAVIVQNDGQMGDIQEAVYRYYAKVCQDLAKDN